MLGLEELLSSGLFALLSILHLLSELGLLGSALSLFLLLLLDLDLLLLLLDVLLCLNL